MKQTNLEFSAEEVALLDSMVGKNFDSYVCDEFLFTPSSYQVVYLTIDDCLYALENKLRVIDYYGAPEDVAVLSLSPWDGSCESRIMGRKTITTPINQVIKNIKLVTDTETMSINDVDVQSISKTKAVIFELSERQVVFEKDIWFSEEINIYRGTDVQGKIGSPDEDIESESPAKFRAERKITNLISGN